jgi:hypothetical protein
MNHSTTTDDATRMFTDATGAFSKMWSEFASAMASNGLGMPKEQSPADAAKKMRDTFFAVWSDACEKYMRSDEFQQMMRDSMKAAIELRKQMNQQMGELQHAVQGASRQDIDQLTRTVENLDARFAETYEQLVGCLEAVTERLDALEQQSTGQAAPKARAEAKPKPTEKKRPRKKPR